MSDISFGLPVALALPLLVAVAWAVWLTGSRRSRGAQSSLTRNAPRAGSIVVPLLLVGAALLAGIAAAQPRWGTEDTVVEQARGNVVFAFDVSRSMDAQDVTPSRILVAREAVAEAMLRLNGSRVGFVIFGGNARLRFPLATDVQATATVMRSLETGTLSVGGGTSTGEALELAVETLGGSGIVVLVTDGDDPSSSAIAAARVFAERDGIQLLIAPVGTAAGATIPVFNRSIGEYQLVTDRTGAAIVTRLNGPFLDALAEASGALLLSDVQRLVTALPAAASDLSRSGEPAAATVPVERFQWFALPAVVLALLALAWNSGVPRRVPAVASAALLALIAAACATEAYELNEDALAALETGDVDGAVSLFYEAAAESPEDAEIALNLSLALHEAGRYQEAIQAASRLERSPLISVRARTQSLIGHHWFALGELERSLAAFREALLLGGEDETARHDFEVVFALLEEQQQQSQDPVPGPDGGSGTNDPSDPGTGGGQTTPGEGQSSEPAAPRERPANQDALNQQLAAVDAEIDSLLEASLGELSAEEALAILELQEERNRLSALRNGFLGFNTTDH